MIIYFSGGGGARKHMPEHELKNPAIMPSYFTNVLQTGKKDKRLSVLIKHRKKRRKHGKQNQG
jgi:hypothetical protein